MSHFSSQLFWSRGLPSPHWESTLALLDDINFGFELEALTIEASPSTYSNVLMWEILLKITWKK